MIIKYILIALALHISITIAYPGVYAKDASIDDCKEFVIVYNRYTKKQEKLLTFDSRENIPNITVERVKKTHYAGIVIGDPEGKEPIGMVHVADCDLSKAILDKSPKKSLINTRTTDIFYLPTEIKGCYAFNDFTEEERKLGYYQLDFVRCESLEK